MLFFVSLLVIKALEHAVFYRRESAAPRGYIVAVAQQKYDGGAPFPNRL